MLCTVRARTQGPGSIVSDWNNALKAGFDVETLRWPGWLLESKLGEEIGHCLPEVRSSCTLLENEVLLLLPLGLRVDRPCLLSA